MPVVLFIDIGSVGDMSNRNWLKKWLAIHWHTDLISASQEPQTELERNAEFLSAILTKRITYQATPKFVIRVLELHGKLPFTPEQENQSFYVISTCSRVLSYRKKWPTN